jgi:amino acid adenylation domain-containing protein
MDSLELDSAVCNLGYGVRLDGMLDVGALEESLNALIARHESLRTTFTVIDGEPVQMVAPACRLEVPIIECSSRADAEHVMTTEAARRFQLSHAPLVRARLIRMGAREHILALTVHHLCFDRSSVEIMNRELFSIYSALTSRTATSLPALPIQYVDFACWQRRRSCGPAFQKHLAYWRTELTGPLPVLNLVPDRISKLQRPGRSIEVLTVLHERADRWKTLGRRSGATLYMTLLAAFSLLLHYYTGQDDIIVGCPITHRERPGLEHIVGCFLNNLALRTDLSGDPTFLELLARVRQKTLEAYEHRDVSLEQLLEELPQGRVRTRTPLFQVILNVLNAPLKTQVLPGLTVTPLLVDHGAEWFDLSVYVEDGPDVLKMWAFYKPELFRSDTIRRLLDHLQVILDSVAVRPGLRLSEVPVLSAEEVRDVLALGTGSASARTGELCVHHLFEAQARRTPDAIAVVSEAGRLTYAELNARANQLARYLRWRGLGPESHVGLSMERSLTMITGLFGIMKAGGVYVPLDPGIPASRLEQMIQDAGVELVLADVACLAVLPTMRTPVVCLDSVWPQIASGHDLDLFDGVTPSNLAYVLYTSGTTGTPKGVAIPHRAVANYTTVAAETYELSHQDRVLQFASLGLDSSVEEIYPCLLRGATLVLRTEEAISTPDTFSRRCEAWGITVLMLPTAYFHELVSNETVTRFRMSSSVRLVVVGGERLSADRLAFWQQCMPDARVVNTYGPTEATVVTTMYDVPRQRSSDAGVLAVPIGRAVANAAMYVLDRYWQPVPAGVVGELYIGGVGLARGYVGLPLLTADRFIPNPFNVSPGSRLYRTGDMVRYLPDGNLEFVGRVDRQVKIRGFRLELDEIEVVLGRCPGIRDVAVVVSDDGADQWLVAYVSSHPERTRTADELRTWLAAHVPCYAVPAEFVFVERIPRTVGGKLNGPALSSLIEGTRHLPKQYIAPRTSVEDVLVSWWSELLKVPQVGVHDNFFALGGHSLLAMRLLFRVQEHFGIEIALRAVFDEPTLEQLALTIEEKILEQVEDLPDVDLVHESACKT